MKRVVSSFAVLLLSSALAHAATGKPDFGNYVGSDTLNPAPKLPTTGANSFLTLPDVSGATHTTIPMNLPADGDDAVYSLGTALDTGSLYDNLLSNCAVSDNGYITCNGGFTLFDNQRLPDARFGAGVVIAPYFDDLTPIPGTSTIDIWVQSGAFAIVQWTNFAVYGNASARLTFRATFQLGDPNNEGSVVFQYLEMMGADGSSATIGIQRPGATAWNQYSYNTAGAITTGTAAAGTALQAIAFGFDQDGDRLSTVFETAIGTDPTLHDSDTGGLDDGAELAAGKDPTSAADDGTAVDTDGDGVNDANEMFYGTDKTKADTDGDSTMTTSLNDADEQYNTHTDPAKADTDGDGAKDGDEIDAGTDPLDPTSTPAQPAVNLNASGAGKSFPRSALDADGMIHVIATASNNSGLYYFMIDQTGAVKIPETFIKLPATGSFLLRRPVIRSFGGKIYITYEFIDDNASTSKIGFVRLNPANAPQDGSPILSSQIVEANTAVAPTIGNPRHHDMQVSASGVHIVYMLYPSRNVRGSSNLGVGYSRLSSDGALQASTTLPLPTKATGGMHHWTRPSVALGSDGSVNMFLLGNVKKSTSSVVWAQFGAGAPKVYDLLMTPSPSYLAVAARGSSFYLFGPTAHNGNAVAFMILDSANFTMSPVTNDYWKAQATIDPASLTVPATSAPAGTHPNQASILVLPNGTAVGYYNHKGTNDLCLQAFLNDGSPSAAPACIAGATNRIGRGHGAPGLDLLPLSDGSVGFVYNQAGQSGIFFNKAPLSRFNFPTTLPVVNTPPRITSTPPSGTVHVGGTYSYAAKATDAETPNALTFSLANGPSGMTVSSAGAVSWKPAAGDVGATTAAVQVCDGGAPARCTSQTLQLTVVPPGAPVIVSVPPTSAAANAAYAYQIVAEDPDNDVASYALVAPSPAKGDLAVSSSGLLTWTPTTADVGATVITVSATDSTGLATQQTFTVQVMTALAIDPQFTSVPATTAVVGTNYAYTAVATDPGDASATFTYSLVSTPSGNMTLSASGALTWKPTDKERGTQAITIAAMSSSGRMSQQSFAVTVVDDKSGGCGCRVGGGGDAPLGVWLVLALGLAVTVLRRRRA